MHSMFRLAVPPLLTQRLLSLAFVTLAGWAATAAALPPLHVLIDTGTRMPQAEIVDDVVRSGLQRDLGLALAERLGREVSFRLLPRRRIADALLGGVQADLLCNYLPAWLPPGLLWSKAFLPDAELLLSSRRVAAPAGLAELSGRPIGTIGGFVYPQFEQVLGVRFRREDAPNAEANMRKLAAGRMDHAIIGRTTFDYLIRRDVEGLTIHPPLVVSSFKTHCALSPRSPVRLAELNAAITALEADGGLQGLLARYR